MWLAVSLASVVVAAPVTPNIRACGSIAREIGDGFQLTQYMYDGSPQFDLKFTPPRSSIRLTGVEMAIPLQIWFYALGSEDTPSVGYANFNFRDLEGRRIGLGQLSLDCGGGTVLRAQFSSAPPPSSFTGPSQSIAPFYGQRTGRCTYEIEVGGKVSFELGTGSNRLPEVSITSSIKLREAIIRASEIWVSEMNEAKAGTCEMRPYLPPPF